MDIEQLFSGEITDQVKEMVRRRLLDGRNLARRKDLKRANVKLVLLLVRELNPLEHFSREELAILMGIDRHTLTKMDQEKYFLHVVNH
jgi:hypothetical protein